MLESLVIGDPHSKSADVGTVISAKQERVIEEYVAQAEASTGVEVRRFGSITQDPTLSPD
ncbi:MAG: hypothetical protein AAGG56_08505 [Pseudomonadota bacterium]